MAQIGLCSVTFRDKTPEDIVSIVENTPLDYVEWAGDAHVPVDLAADDIKKIANLYPVSSYGSYYHAGTDDNFDDILNTAKTLGTSNIRIWAGEMDMEKVWGVGVSDEFEKIASDIKDKAKISQNDGINLYIEHHQWTYGDSTDATVKLMEAIDEPNVYVNWQPLIKASVEDIVKDIETLGPWISNVHVFNWDEEFNRYPLSDGKDAWTQYIQALEQFPFEGRKYLLEFVKDDSIEQLKADADTLAELISNKKRVE